MTDTLSSSGRAGATRLDLPPALDDQVRAALQRAISEHWASRIWGRDTSLWTADAQVAETIANRLGWLDAPGSFAEQLEELDGFAQGIRDSGFSDAIVCGMGGSSLAPTVLAHAYPRSAHGLRLRVLDSTDPDAVRAVEPRAADRDTLHLIATKSGTTTETLAFLAHFWELAEQRTGLIRRGERGDGFAAITDPGASMRAIPHVDVFREAFLNPPDVGGRYSALTYVGLVPGALLGLRLDELLADAAQMADRCRADETDNPGLALGVAMGALARAGRDKLTLVLEPALAAFGSWVEQLIAESTGKNGTGIVPVDGEPLGDPEVYGDDRVFVRLARPDETDWHRRTSAQLAALAAAGHPVIDLPLEAGAWLGGEFFRWEFATAVAGAVLGVNAFDEPNVTESKEKTRAVLERFRTDGQLPAEEPIAAAGRLRVIGDAPLRLTSGAGSASHADVAAELRRHLARARPNGYLAIQAYLAPTDARTAVLRALQARLRDGTRHATTLGYGPRFLHSTGQLHKGGPTSGCFLQLTAGHPDDLPIPGREESFGTLIDAQALGDFASLQAHELPVLRVHLSDDPDAGLEELATAVQAALA
jgi:glucose-6-phosphate isomerase